MTVSDKALLCPQGKGTVQEKFSPLQRVTDRPNRANP